MSQVEPVKTSQPDGPSAIFKDAMAAVAALRDADNARKSDEFRMKMCLSDMNLSLSRVERIWRSSNSIGVPQAAAHIDPVSQQPLPVQTAELCRPAVGDANSLFQFATEISSRIESIAQDMADQLESNAKHTHNASPRLSLTLPPSPETTSNVFSAVLASNSSSMARLSPSRRSPGKRPNVVIVDDLSCQMSQVASACFSPRSSRKNSAFSVSDSISFVPEEALRPNADDLVSRGTMTRIRVTASTSAQTQCPALMPPKSPTGSPQGALEISTFHTSDMATLSRYAALLEKHCSPADIEACRLLVGSAGDTE